MSVGVSVCYCKDIATHSVISIPPNRVNASSRLRLFRNLSSQSDEQMLSFDRGTQQLPVAGAHGDTPEQIPDFHDFQTPCICSAE